jgi:hypothetical protein
MPQIKSLEPPEDHAICPGKAGTSNLRLVRPTCRTVCGRRLRLSSSPYRHRKCSYDGKDSARCSDACALDEHSWRIGIVGIPPPEEGRRKIDRNAWRKFKPGVTKLGLIAEPPRRPLRRGPRREQHDGQDAGDLAPKNSSCGHGKGNQVTAQPTDKSSCPSRVSSDIPASKLVRQPRAAINKT